MDPISPIVFVVVGLFVIELAIGAFCGFIAKEKHQNESAWFFLGLLFSVIALLAVVGLPTRQKS
jgi:hypothetical protein